MNRKKLIAIGLIVFWGVLIVERLVSRSGRVEEPAPPPASRVVSGAPEASLTTYPPLRFALNRPNLFSELVSAQPARKEEQEQKKVVTIPAPPLPLLPEEPKAKKDEKKEDAVDPLRDVTLVGVLDAKTRRIAFIKKGKDIRQFTQGDFVFDSKFFVEKVDTAVVILKNNAGEKRSLETVKEGKDDKK